MIASAAVAGRLEGRGALITGGASGIGREAALLFAAEGARVAVVDVADADGAGVVAEIEATGGIAHCVRADVSRSEEVAAAVAEAERVTGALHVLFNNAGIFPSADGSPTHTDESIWDRVMEVNLKGVFHFHGIHSFAPSILHHHHDAATSLGHGLHAPSENPISTHDNLVAGL